MVPGVNAAEEAGKIIADLPGLWVGANEEEKRKLLLTMLDAVYVNTKEDRSIVAIKLKPPFRPTFEVATTSEGSDVILTKDPPQSDALDTNGIVHPANNTRSRHNLQTTLTYFGY